MRKLLSRLPDAVAIVLGDSGHADIEGTVKFFAIPEGVMVLAEISGLPINGGFFGLHIHSGSGCSGSEDDPFADSGMHYDTEAKPHPYHSGDLPPLLNASGNAILAALTDRFEIGEILGRTVIIHSSPDDFSTQPSGNAGHKIACGEIRSVRR